MVASNLSTDAVTELIEQNLDIARSVAFRLKRRFPWVNMEDLHSYSRWGLTRAAGHFSPDSGTPFVYFAPQKAFYLGIDAMREDKVVRRGTQGPATTSHARQNSLSSSNPLPDEVVDEHSADDMQRLEAKDYIVSLLGRLNDRDRQLLMLYYSDGMTFKEIAAVFDRSESAVSIRHGTLLAKLRRFAGVSNPPKPPKTAQTLNGGAQA
jgi:RNA polymerase sigma factor (sigma-70 family)